MTPERWSKIKNIFHQALECAPDERAAFLDQTCAGDGEIRTQVERMLAADAKENLVIDRTAVESVAQLFARAEAEAITGRTFGHYRVEREIGRGGMGRVYLAQDTRLGRPVALKLMPDTFSQDPERVRRFQQEARVVSALNHPYIMTIHEIGETDGLRYIVSEFVDGETLRDIIARGDGDLSDLLKIAVQVAEALSAAHGVGIVHRDIKPENIMVRRDGYVKVLDFGLAKPSEEWNTQSDSAERQFSHFTTSPGLILGTANYMSPEQARGYDVDARTDIFSFGVVLYEAVTGHSPFDRKTKADTLIAIAGEEPPPINSVIPEASPRLQQIIDKALRKHREERYQNIDEMRRDLEEFRNTLSLHSGIRAQLDGATVSDAIKVRSTSRADFFISKIKRNKIAFGALSLAAVLLVAALGFGLYKQFASRVRQTRFSPTNLRYTKLTTSGNVWWPVISPDGKFIVFMQFEDAPGYESLWVRQLATGRTTQIVPPMYVQLWGLTFSPDGNYVYYTVADRANPVIGALYRVPFLGGPSKKILDEVHTRVTFSPDGRQMAFPHFNRATKNADLTITDLDGNSPRIFASTPAPGFLSFQWSPDGRTVAYISAGQDEGGNYWFVGERPATGGPERRLTALGRQEIDSLTWMPDGRGLVMEMRDPVAEVGQLWHLSYPGGQIERITNDLNDYLFASVSADGQSLVTMIVNASTDVWLVPNGDTSAAHRITNSMNAGIFLSWTPDGKIIDDLIENDQRKLRVISTSGEQQTLTSGGGTDSEPAVSGDGRFLFFASSRSGSDQLWRTDIDGSHPIQITRDFESAHFPRCSHDGRWVFFLVYSEFEWNVWRMPVDGGTAERLTSGRSSIMAISPDDHWLAYKSYDAEAKRWRVKLRPLTGEVAERVLDISPSSFRWTPDGRSLAYIDGNKDPKTIMIQSLKGGSPKPFLRFDGDRIYSFDWSWDGSQLAVTRGMARFDAVLVKGDSQ